MSEFEFIDETNDKKYFTIIPNIIINGYSAVESGVYLYIKRRCGEKREGSWNENKDTAAKNLGIDFRTLKRIIEKLEKDNRIKCIGYKIFNTKPVKVYQMCDIWKENTLQYKDKKISGFNELSQKISGFDEFSKVDLTYLKNNNIKNNILSKDNTQESTIPDDIKPLKIFSKSEYGNKEINTLLAEFKKKTKLQQFGESDTKTRQSASTILKRYTLEQALDCIDWLLEQTFWYDNLTKISQLYYQMPKYIRENEIIINEIKPKYK